MIPIDCAPRRGPVTVLAFVAESGAVDVVLAADPVTVVAARGRSFDHAVLVAILTGRHEVASFERKKPGFVEGTRRATGPLRIHVVAVLACRPELAAVRIRMARRAAAEALEAFRDINGRLVTIRARGGGVPAAEEGSRLVMGVMLNVEGRGGMTIVA